jgi:hypothetical protein
MYIIREIFHLQFGSYCEAKVLLDETRKNNPVKGSTEIA